MATKAVNIAAVVPAAGADFVFEEQPMQVPGPGEILIRNHVIALNPIDWKRRDRNFWITYPAILGLDAAGEVAALGPDVKDFKVGDRVASMLDGLTSGKPGHFGYQTFSVARAAMAMPLPRGVTAAQGASLTTSAATAGVVLFDTMGVPRPPLGVVPAPTPPAGKDSIVIWGAGGNLGSITVQMALLAGMAVYATASPRHHDHLRAWGVSAVVDYRSPTAAEDLASASTADGRPICLALDCNGGKESTEAAARALVLSPPRSGTNKKLLMYATPLTPDTVVPDGLEHAFVQGERAWAEGSGIETSRWLFHEALPSWIESGRFVVPPVRTVPGGFAGIAEGLRQLRDGVSGEKLVVEI